MQKETYCTAFRCVKYQIRLEKEGKNVSKTTYHSSGNGKSRNLGTPEASRYVQRCRDTSWYLWILLDTIRFH